MKPIEKTEIYKDGNFTISKYDFEIPNVDNAWKIINLIDLKTIKRRWSEETGNYYQQSQYITISENQMSGILSTLAWSFKTSEKS